tara:strand:- start:176 stop:919 length:744 start_codon:yes stop_codon:yes gene_type:complete
MGSEIVGRGENHTLRCVFIWDYKNRREKEMENDSNSKLITTANDRISQWDTWADSYFDKSNRRHKSAKNQVDALRAELDEDDIDYDEVDYCLGMVETAFRKTPNPNNNEPPIMSRGKSVVTPEVKGIKLGISKRCREALTAFFLANPFFLHLYRTSWGDDKETGGESYHAAGLDAEKLASDIADSLADKASSQPFRAYHNKTHEGDTNVIVAEFDEDMKVTTYDVDGLTLIELTAYRNKPSKDGGES